jgi:drug/metabolite transporter, DME family
MRVPRPVPDAAGGARLLAAAGVLWGGAGAVGRMLARVGQLSSWQIATGRALLGGLALLVAAIALGRPRPRGARAGRHILTMALLTVVYQSCYFAAVAAGSLSLATLVTLGSGPVFVTAVHAVAHRRLSAPALGILALALVGLGLLVGRPDAAGNVGLVTALSLTGGAAFAAMTLVNQDAVPGADHIAATGVAFVVASGVLAGMLAVLPATPVTWSWRLVGWLAVLAVACTAAPYACYFSGLLRASAPVAALFALLEPLTGTLIAVVAFGERLGVLGWAGAGLLCAAVAASALNPDAHGLLH